MDENISKIDPFLRKLLTFEGFCRQYYLFCSDYSTQEKAYEATERIYEANFGKRKYANFESFRQVRNRKLKT